MATSEWRQSAVGFELVYGIVIGATVGWIIGTIISLKQKWSKRTGIVIT